MPTSSTRRSSTGASGTPWCASTFWIGSAAFIADWDGEDPERVRQVLLDVAMNCPGVAQEPMADVLLDDLAESAIVFNVRVWSSEYSYRPRMLKSLLYYAVLARFKAEGIQIPFPQRDLHLIPGKPKEDGKEVVATVQPPLAS